MIRDAALGQGPTIPAFAAGDMNKAETKNWRVQAHWATNAVRPPTPISHFFLSKSAIIAAQAPPRTRLAPKVGLTAVLAIPAKEPQTAATHSFSGSIKYERAVVAIVDPTWPIAAWLFNTKVNTVDTTTVAAVMM